MHFTHFCYWMDPELNHALIKGYQNQINPNQIISTKSAIRRWNWIKFNWKVYLQKHSSSAITIRVFDEMNSINNVHDLSSIIDEPCPDGLKSSSNTGPPTNVLTKLTNLLIWVSLVLDPIVYAPNNQLSPHSPHSPSRLTNI